MYQVLSKTFDTFDEVITWAWNEYHIADFEPAETEEEKHVACKELAGFIQELEVAQHLD